MTAEPPLRQSSGLDRALSDPTRLALMAVPCDVDWCEFAFLRDTLSVSDSALSKQLAKLKSDGYIEQRRTCLGRVAQDDGAGH